MVIGLIVPADIAVPIHQALFHVLADYQAAVGGLIEAIDLADIALSVYVNEEGLIHGFPLNERVTALWWAFEPELRYRVALAGDAVIVGQPDIAGDSTDIPEAMLIRLSKWLS